MFAPVRRRSWSSRRSWLLGCVVMTNSPVEEVNHGAMHLLRVTEGSRQFRGPALPYALHTGTMFDVHRGLHRWLTGVALGLMDIQVSTDWIFDDRCKIVQRQSVRVTFVYFVCFVCHPVALRCRLLQRSCLLWQGCIRCLLWSSPRRMSLSGRYDNNGWLCQVPHLSPTTIAR